MTSPLLGIELLLAHYGNDLKSKCDALLAHVHWKLISGGLRCVGTGEDFGALKVFAFLLLTVCLSVCL